MTGGADFPDDALDLENQKHDNPDTENHDEEGSVDFPDGVPDLEDQKHNNPGTESRDEEGSLVDIDMSGHSPLLERIHMLHRRLGHPSNEALVRMLQHGGAKDEVLKLAADLACPTCQMAKAPHRSFPARPEVRAVVFNTVIHADLKYLKDFRGEVYVALSVVDEATNYHLAKLLRNREPSHVAAKFMSMWIGLFGPPQKIRLDQGGEWESDFIQLLKAHSIHSEFVGSHSPWSNGYAERHGALLGVAVQANVDEKQLTGRSQMKLGLSCACQAKNSVISRGGRSAHFLVFGRQAAYPELLDDEVWARKSLGFALSIEGEVARAAELRAASKVALLRGDVLEKIKRALRRAPAGERRNYTPGEIVYFYSPAGLKSRRYKKDLGCWRGPAVVLMAEGVDMTQDDPPPLEAEAPFSVEGPDLAARRRLNGSGRKLTEARRMMAGLKSVKKILKGPLDPKQRRRLLPQRRPKKGRTIEDPLALPPGAPSEERAEEPVPENCC